MSLVQENYFNDIPAAPYDFLNPVAGGGISPQYGGGSDQIIQIGTGDTAFTVDLTGLWMGAGRFAQAPWRVKMNGNQVAKILTADDELILDDKGLLSLFNFPLQQKSKSDDQTISDTDWQTLTGLGHRIQLERPANILFFTSVSGYHDDVDERLDFRITVNNVQVGGIFTLSQLTANPTLQTKSAMVGAQIPNDPEGIDVVVQARSSNANDGYIKGADIPCVSSYFLLGR